LNIHYRDQLLGHFETSVPQSNMALREMRARLPAAEGFRLELLVAEDERRYVESGPGGIRLIASIPLFQSAPADVWDSL
jgi:hypothetical protein